MPSFFERLYIGLQFKAGIRVVKNKWKLCLQVFSNDSSG